MPYVYKKNENGDFVCEHCGKVVPKENPSTMHYHLKKHDGDLPFQCAHCPYKCQFQRTLDLHLAAKHPESEQAKKKKLLKCPCCEFETLTQGNRIIHFIRKHCRNEVNSVLEEKDNSYSCKRCQKVFASSTAFHYHCADCITIKDSQKRQQLLTMRA